MSNNSSYRPSGIYSAQWLPSDASGRLDRAALAAHLAFEKRAGVAGVLAEGSITSGTRPVSTSGGRSLSLHTLLGAASPPSSASALALVLATGG